MGVMLEGTDGCLQLLSGSFMKPYMYWLFLQIHTSDKNLQIRHSKRLAIIISYVIK